MKVAIVGSGYMGLVTGTCFSETGNDVWCVDIDERKIKNLQNRILPIYEPGLEDMVHKNIATENLRFTMAIGEALAVSNICFITVGTPMKEDGSADLRYVLATAKNIGKTRIRHMYIVDKSTVSIGTAALVRNTIQKELDKRGVDLTFDMISNPEIFQLLWKSINLYVYVWLTGTQRIPLDRRNECI